MRFKIRSPTISFIQTKTGDPRLREYSKGFTFRDAQLLGGGAKNIFALSGHPAFLRFSSATQTATATYLWILLTMVGRE